MFSAITLIVRTVGSQLPPLLHHHRRCVMFSYKPHCFPVLVHPLGTCHCEKFLTRWILKTKMLTRKQSQNPVFFILNRRCPMKVQEPLEEKVGTRGPVTPPNQNRSFWLAVFKNKNAS